MGVDVVLMQVVQRGTSPKKRRLTPVQFVQDEADLFSNLCVHSSLPMLSQVDPYRTQILTSADMHQFIAEVDATRALTAEEREQELLHQIRRLAERCSEIPGLEIHLQGD
jgi:hypothetical protein